MALNAVPTDSPPWTNQVPSMYGSCVQRNTKIPRNQLDPRIAVDRRRLSRYVLRVRIDTTRISVSTSGRVSVHNLTMELERYIAHTGLQTGVCVISVQHTTCGLTLNEDESGLVSDFERVAQELLSPLAKSRPFAHDRIDDNTMAHLTATLVGNSLTVPIRAGSLNLGTWQSVLLLEGDGPRTRHLDVTVIGE